MEQDAKSNTVALENANNQIESLEDNFLIEIIEI